jgi:hypothetical protein
MDSDPICIAPPKEAKRSGVLVAIGDGFEKKTANVDEPAALAVTPALLAWSCWRISVVYLIIRCLWLNGYHHQNCGLNWMATTTSSIMTPEHE